MKIEINIKDLLERLLILGLKVVLLVIFFAIIEAAGLDKTNVILTLLCFNLLKEE